MSEQVCNDCNLLRNIEPEELPIKVYYAHAKASATVPYIHYCDSENVPYVTYGDPIHTQKNRIMEHYKHTLKYWKVVEAVLVQGWQHRCCSNYYHAETYEWFQSHCFYCEFK